MSRFVLCLIFATLAVTFVSAGEANVELSKVGNVEKVPQVVKVLYKVKDQKNVKDDENDSSDSDDSDDSDDDDSHDSDDDDSDDSDDDDSDDSDDDDSDDSDDDDSDDSKSNNEKKCGPREKWDKCGSLHEQNCCVEKRSICPKIVCSKKTAGCRCKHGAVRDLKSGKCIEKKKCKKICEKKQ